MNFIQLIGAVFQLLAVSMCVSGKNQNCQIFSESLLNPKECTVSKRNNDDGDFKDLYRLLEDAHKYEDSRDFIVEQLVNMYKYIHCADAIMAIAALFYGLQKPDQLPPSSSQFWPIAYEFVHGSQAAAPLVGRRRRRSIGHFANDDELSIHKYKGVIADLGPACIQWLIGIYKGQAANHFRNSYNFPDPNKYLLATTSTISTMPSTRVFSSQSMSNSTTNALSAPTHNGPTMYPSSPTVTSTMASTRPISNARCWQCADIDCLLRNASAVCGPGQDLCITSINEGPMGRDITRGCANKTWCDGNPRSRACDDVDVTRLPPGVTCEFCCRGDNCNRPPAIRPHASQLYGKP